MRNLNRQGPGSRNQGPGNNERERTAHEIFFDTANVNEIREAANIGVVDGVTINPSLIAKESREFKKVIDQW